jgi:serine/threonine-protein kinase RsbW
VDRVSVTVPAAPEYIKVVRLIAAGLAARIHFTLEDIDDLKIAVDELSAYLTGTQGRSGRIEIHFDVDDDEIAITGIGRLDPGEKVRSDLTDFSRMILDTVADEASLIQLDGSPTFTLKKARAG